MDDDTRERVSAGMRKYHARRRGDEEPEEQPQTDGPQYAILYYRSREWAEKYRAAGLCRPTGWFYSPHRYTNWIDARREQLRLNRAGPLYPAQIVRFQ